MPHVFPHVNTKVIANLTMIGTSQTRAKANISSLVIYSPWDPVTEP